MYPADRLRHRERAGGVGPVPTPFSGGDIAIDRTGGLVAVTGGMNGDLATYDVETGAALGILPGLRRPRHIRNWRDTGALVFAGAGRLFFGSMRGPVREVDARTLEVVRTLDAPPMSTHNYMALTNDGLLVTAGDDAPSPSTPRPASGDGPTT